MYRPWSSWALAAMVVASILLFMTGMTLMVQWNYRDYLATLRGRDAYVRRDYRAAEEFFKRGEDSKAYRYLRAAAFVHSNCSNEVPRVLGTPTDELSPKELNVLGVAAMEGGTFGDPVRWLEEAVRREPRTALYHHNLAVAFERAGRKQEAARERQKAVKLGGAKYAQMKEPIPAGLDLGEE